MHDQVFNYYITYTIKLVWHIGGIKQQQQQKKRAATVRLFEVQNANT